MKNEENWDYYLHWPSVLILIYSRILITRTLANPEPRANSNQHQFPVDFVHTVTVILPSATQTLDNSNLPLTQTNFHIPSFHFCIILRSITRTTFFRTWQAKKYSTVDQKLNLLWSNRSWVFFQFVQFRVVNISSHFFKLCHLTLSLKCQC